jgi:hypothetical protein
MHHPVDRTGAAEHFATWPKDLPVPQMRFFFREVRPINGRAKQFEESRGVVDRFHVIIATSLDQKN